ncbi:YlbF family regulator [Chryseomicrobium sp. FSL W7-1435]|uniref:YlbF family regulator n=1 Tax=Chryseomicrobium sp. FSL W7-1435 TaxID=2921704 RepID=UPI00315A32B4
MQMTSDWSDILDHVDELNEFIMTSEIVAAYHKAYQDVYSTPEVARVVHEFSRLKETYEEVQRFGKYHPDYKSINTKIRVKKREMDLIPQVTELKAAENDVQDLLDELSLLLAHAVSHDIKVPVSNPFFQSATGSCSTGCGTGSGCACSA